MKLATANKRRANRNGRIQGPRLVDKRRRTKRRYYTGARQTPFMDFERDMNPSRHSGNVIRNQGTRVFENQQGRS
jgi:hypothetical protein